MLLLFFLIYLLFPVTKIFAQTPITNLSSDIVLSEFMSKPSDEDEWVEIYNIGSQTVLLNNWKIDDIIDGGRSAKTIPDITIQPNSFYVLSLGDGFLNNEKDSVNLINHNGEVVDSYSYLKETLDISWSKQSDGSWCQTNPTKGNLNNICLNPPTNTPTATPSPTLTPSPTNTTNPTPTTISPNIYIDSAPKSVNPNQVFSLQFSIQNPSPNFDYRLKVVYGSGNESDKTCLVKTVYPDNTTLNFNSSWSSFPIYKSSDSNTISGTIKAVLSDCTNGSTLPNSLSVKIKSENDILSQNLKYIDIKKDPTPIPTKIPTSTLKPTLTPTLSISPSLTDTITDTPSPQPSPEILGEYDDIAQTISFITPTATPSAKTNQANIFNIIPYFLITTGGGLLLTPTLITKLKKK